jgi:hypothetical protein
VGGLGQSRCQETQDQRLHPRLKRKPKLAGSISLVVDDKRLMNSQSLRWLKLTVTGCGALASVVMVFLLTYRVLKQGMESSFQNLRSA